MFFRMGRTHRLALEAWEKLNNENIRG